MSFPNSLYFSVLPKIVPFNFDNPMSTGEAAQVACMISSGDQPFEISWTFNGRSINGIPGISATMTKKASMLLIDPLAAEHRGNYTCTVKNPAGIVNFTAGLSINGNFVPSLLA